MGDVSVTSWCPGFCLQSPPEKDKEYALLILNRPISDKEHFIRLWKYAKLRVCADGGANRLYDVLDDTEKAEYLPDCITGDLDSLHPSIKSYYSSHNVTIIQDEDQYSTDFTKSIKYINTHHDPPVIDVIALGGWGGRVDQSFASVQQLYSTRTTRRVFLLSEENVSFLLKPGKNVVETPADLFGPTCGIIPVGGKAVVTTAGLEWDLHSAETKFGGLVSTSNHLAKDVIEITTNVEVLFTVEIRRKAIN